MKANQKIWHVLLFLVIATSLVMPKPVQAYSSHLVPLEQQMPCTPITTFSPSYNFSTPPVNLMLVVYKSSLAFEATVKYCDNRFSVDVNDDSVVIGSSMQGTGVKINSDGNFETSFPISVSDDSHDVVVGSFPLPFIAYQHHFNRSVDVSGEGLIVSSSNSQEHKFEFAFPDTVQFNYAVDPVVVEQMTYSLAALGAAVLIVELGLPVAAGAAIFVGVLAVQPPPEAQAATVLNNPIPQELRTALETKFPEITRVAGFGTLSSDFQQLNPGAKFSYSGQGYSPNGEVLITFGLPGSTDLEWKIVQADSTGAIHGSITLPAADQVPSGRYLLSATDQTTAYYAAKNILNSGDLNSGKVYIAGTMLDVAGGTANPDSLAVNHQNNWTPSAPQPVTCSNISLHDPHTAYLFGGTNCSGDLTWFSAHPENGPSANSSSLYVPSNSVVKVSSQDNGGGETACFTSTQTDLGAWRNKIQWAQLVPGGSCPVVTADGYVIHTNQGDFRVNNGQSWDNTQHNRQIWGFDRQGSVHLKINHVNGAQRCWDESKTTQQLQNDGDWWIQTRSIEIGSGYCPGMSGQLEVYSLANFQGGRHDIRAGNLRTYPDNDLKYSLRFTQPGMSAKLTNADGRTRCWNTNINNLQDHEDYWHRTTKIEVFGNDVCPKPIEVPAGANFAPGSNVKYTYYEYIAPMVGLPIPNIWTPVSTGYAGNFAINQVPHRDNDFAIRFESCLTVPSTGSYTFYTTSDDGSKLYINGQNIVDNDGYHSSSEKSGTVNLTAGVHSIAVDYFEGGVEQMLGVAWQGPNFAKQWMPNQQLAMTGCSWELKKQLPTIKPDMFAIAKSGLTAGTTGVKLLTGSSNFSTVQGTYPTYVEEDTRQNYAWAYELADYNFDGTLDIYAFKKTGTGSGMTELHILNGASNYRSFALQTPTTLGATGYDYVWDFELGDYDKDGRLDAFAINKKYTGQRKVELHILKGAGNFQTWCAHIVTALPELSNLDYWDFELADYDGDKNLDLFAFNKTGTASGKIELNILKGPTFSSIAVQQQLPISTIFSATNRQLELADYSGDGVQDLYVVDSVGSTGVVEVTVWDGNGTFQNRLASLLTAQPNVSDGGTRWLFRFARLKGQILGASLSDGAGETLPDTVAPVDNVPVNLLFLPLLSK